MIVDQIIELQIGDEIHIPDAKGACESWTIEKRFDKYGLRATRPTQAGYWSTLINPGRYNLVNIHLASECQYEQRSKNNGTY